MNLEALKFRSYEYYKSSLILCRLFKRKPLFDQLLLDTLFLRRKIAFLYWPVNFEMAYAAQKLIDRISFLAGNSAEEF